MVTNAAPSCHASIIGAPSNMVSNAFSVSYAAPFGGISSFVFDVVI